MNNDTASFYNKLSFIYPLINLFLRHQKHALFKEINNLPDGNLLEIGVGNGSHLRHYKKHHITGIDTSPVMLETARKTNQNTPELFLMNGESLLFDDAQFDYVVLSHVIAVVDDPERLLTETYRVLKPRGRIFILNHFTPDNWMKYLDHAFEPVSRYLHFKSVFRLNQIATLRRFRFCREISFYPGSYFKLLIYQK